MQSTRHWRRGWQRTSGSQVFFLLTDFKFGTFAGMRNTFIAVVLWATTCVWSWAQQNAFEPSLSPKLRQFLSKHPDATTSLTNSVSEAFSNRTCSVYYFYTDAPSEPRAYHFYPTTIGAPDVVLCVSEQQKPLDEFITLLFETLNSRGEARFSELTEAAKAGTISRSEFAREILRQEFEATKSTREKILALKLRNKEKSTSHYYQLYTKCPGDFDGFLTYAKRMSDNRDAFKYYEAEYDTLRKGQ